MVVVVVIVLALALAAFWWKKSRTAREDPEEEQEKNSSLYEEIDETNLDSHHDEENEADTTDIQPQTDTQTSTTETQESVGEAGEAIPLTDIQPAKSGKQGIGENSDPSGYDRLSFQVKDIFEEEQESAIYHKLEVMDETEFNN